MESRDVRLTHCEFCGVLKAEGRPCRFCEEGGAPSGFAESGAGTHDPWGDLSRDVGGDAGRPDFEPGGLEVAGMTPAGRRKAGRRRAWVLTGAVVLLAAIVAAIIVSAGRSTSYESQVRTLSAALSKASGELAPLLGRGDGLNVAELARVRTLCDEISDLTRQGWTLRPTAEVVEAHSYFTGALTNLDRVCGTARSFVDYALHTDRPENTLALEALATLGAANIQLTEVKSALEREPAPSP